ncbi:hypothetical protein DUF69_23845 [Salmonella enterica]|nr:hypothetical protein [Salmonella enterica]EBS4770857.1 hypothetical protein [Salmonella enterica subsp. enterica serovar Sandiego]ECU9092988.1 hypothetical protein [Salmonella enterica subsp. enterica serovar Cotham]EAM3248627.1 hypothetical protein [Salmonella enterica]EAM3626352.1 hypothetical protein [Salmonella enterica]
MQNIGAAVPITTGLLASANLQQARTKSATGSLLSMSESRQVNRGRSATMLRRHGSDDALAGGASVVVRDGESPLHGEGKQFKCVC